MNKLEFTKLLGQLGAAYGMKFNPQQINAYYRELGGADARDLAEAIERLPALETRGMPNARTIDQYVADAREQRLYDEKQANTKTLDNLYDVYREQAPPEPEQAYSAICAAYIKWRMDGWKEKPWVAMAQQFLKDHMEWMADPRKATEVQHVRDMAAGKANTAKLPERPFQTLHTGVDRRTRKEDRTWLHRQCQAPGCLNMSRQEADKPSQADYGRYYCKTHAETVYVPKNRFDMKTRMP